jgi:predicted AAA+ superfamily ATPase
MEDFIPRHIDAVIDAATESFSAILVTGARQVGKSTLLRMREPDASYSTLDSVMEYDAALSDPIGYIDTRRLPAIIDEIQYAPDLLRAMKIKIDAAKFDGNRQTLFFATGSQRFPLMKDMSESLAGRAFVLEILGLTQREIARIDFTEPFVPTIDYVKRRHVCGLAPVGDDIWKAIFRGDMPELAVRPDLDALMFYEAYVNTYIRRDVRDLSQVGDLAAFGRFMRIVSAMCGQQVNKAAIARDLGMSQPTVDRWLSVLEASGIIMLLPPYYKNVKKRLVKMPKLYFLNSGLACRLYGIDSAKTLATSPMAGHLFECFAISEIAKSHLNATGTMPELYYYRDSEGAEIDLLISTPGGIHPIEFKASGTVRSSDAKRFSLIESVLGEKQLQGAVVGCFDDVLPLTRDVLAVPVGLL